MNDIHECLDFDLPWPSLALDHQNFRTAKHSLNHKVVFWRPTHGLAVSIKSEGRGLESHRWKEYLPR